MVSKITLHSNKLDKPYFLERRCMYCVSSFHLQLNRVEGWRWKSRRGVLAGLGQYSPGQYPPSPRTIPPPPPPPGQYPPRTKSPLFQYTPGQNPPWTISPRVNIFCTNDLNKVLCYYSFTFDLRYRNGNQLTTENKSRSDHICQELNEQVNEHLVTKPWVEFFIT